MTVDWPFEKHPSSATWWTEFVVVVSEYVLSGYFYTLKLYVTLCDILAPNIIPSFAPHSVLCMKNMSHVTNFLLSNAISLYSI